jgi:hypothetical protein
MVTREAIVAAARSWLGTPYHHQASVKGVGDEQLQPGRTSRIHASFMRIALGSAPNKDIGTNHVAGTQANDLGGPFGCHRRECGEDR